MKKLSNIIESFWGDVHRRSRGDEIRKEDDVNNMIPEDFFEYLKVHYVIDNTSTGWDISNNTETSSICIPFVADGIHFSALFLNYDEYVVYIHNQNQKDNPQLWNELEKNFDLWKDDPEYRRYTIINPLDTNRPINNSYVLEVLDFIIDNLDSNKHLCISKKTNESFWGDVHRRSRGDEIRKEDDITNIRDIKPIDMGVSVLWADKDLEYRDGSSYFTYDEANELIKNSGWRLPNTDEVLELFGTAQEIKNTDEVCIVEDKSANHSQLVFNKKGYISAIANLVFNEQQYLSWTSVKSKSPRSYFAIHIMKHLSHTPMQKDNKCCVRLVKDK